jgi:lipoprotein-anchoring transpeptidase ErfK/SrfK
MEGHVRRALGIIRRLATLLAAAAVVGTAAPAAGNAPAAASPGVSVGGVPVAGLGWSPARRALLESVDRPVRFSLGVRSWSIPALRFGPRADVDEALTAALAAPAGTKVPLHVEVPRALVRAYAASIAAEVDSPAQDARLVGLENLRPVYAEERSGRELDRAALVKAIERSLRRNDRSRIPIRLRAVEPTVRLGDLPPVVVIRRDSKRLDLYSGTTHVRSFSIATGSAEFPTPLGQFAIVDMQRNPWWYPPASDWAKDLEPVPPGPGNPLGTRWMGLDRGLVGIHGTPDAASIGYSASHGCIRMYTWEADWLFDQVRWGTPVFIVSA